MNRFELNIKNEPFVDWEDKLTFLTKLRICLGIFREKTIVFNFENANVNYKNPSPDASQKEAGE